ncbi:RE1 [Symbiodinium natans]|uniref:RE1 protein n=1 Tax=Symbiodinium natans TaxID=878477 RepID=A0A812KSY7_9DINO|nr:RE1 [Symbiodinium natans]
MQIGFARAFCDIHCVRDAVIRGDRSIIRNLEMATKKTNSNLKALVKWSVDASHTDIGWIGEKLDYMHAIDKAYMQEIHETWPNNRGGRTGVQQKNQTLMRHARFSELAGYAQAASFDELSKITAKRAVEEFLESADFSPKANATAAASLLGRLDALHQTLKRAGRGREKSEMLNRQVAQTVRHLQRQASFHLRTLGVYRQESNASSHAARGKVHKALARERHQVLMSLDHIWWQLRTKLDGYLDVAEDEVKAFQTSLAEMNSYLELRLIQQSGVISDCKKGFSDLAAGYAQSISALSRSHRRLRATWREGSAAHHSAVLVNGTTGTNGYGLSASAGEVDAGWDAAASPEVEAAGGQTGPMKRPVDHDVAYTEAAVFQGAEYFTPRSRTSMAPWGPFPEMETLPSGWSWISRVGARIMGAIGSNELVPSPLASPPRQVGGSSTLTPQGPRPRGQNLTPPSSSGLSVEAVQAEVQRQLGPLLDRLEMAEQRNSLLEGQLKQQMTAGMATTKTLRSPTEQPDGLGCMEVLLQMNMVFLNHEGIRIKNLRRTGMPRRQVGGTWLRVEKVPVHIGAARVKAWEASRVSMGTPEQSFKSAIFKEHVEGILREAVLRTVEGSYSKWLGATQLERLTIQPEDADFAVKGRWTRVNARACQLLLNAVPEVVRSDLIARRATQDVTQLVFRLFVLYQPGGSSERGHTLAQLQSPPHGTNVAETLEILRGWPRHLRRCQQLGMSAPDPTVLAKGLDMATAKLITGNPDAHFRTQLLRTSLRLDAKPTLRQVEDYQRHLQAEVEQMAAAGGNYNDVVAAHLADWKGGGKRSHAKREEGAERMQIPPTTPKVAEIQATSAEAIPSSSSSTIMSSSGSSIPPSAATIGSAEGVATTPGEPVWTLDNLMQAAQQVVMAKSAGEKGDIKLKAAKVMELDAINERSDRAPMALADTGATHSLRHPHSQEEWDRSMWVNVVLAGGEQVQMKMNNAGTLLFGADGTARETTTNAIVPVGELVKTLGYRFEWGPASCHLVGPDGTIVRLSTKEGCPHISEARALELISKIEKKKLDQFTENVKGTEARVQAMARTLDKSWFDYLGEACYGHSGQEDKAVAAAPFLKDVPAEALYGLATNVDNESGWQILKKLTFLNRRQRRRLWSSKSWVVHLFAGKTKKEAFSWLNDGDRVLLELDIARSQGHNLLDQDLWRALSWAASQGKIAAVIGGPPCRTFSRLRFREPGPSPVRSRANPYGWPDQSPSERLQVTRDTKLFVRMLWLHAKSTAGRLQSLGRRMSASTVAFVLEQPQDPHEYLPSTTPNWSELPSFWDTEMWKRYAAEAGLTEVSFEQGAYGHKAIKPTTLGTNMMSLALLRGAKTKGVLEPFDGPSEALAAWAPGLCAAISLALKEWLVTPALTAMTVGQWKEHVARGHLPPRRDCLYCSMFGASGRPHRRVSHPEMFTLTSDLSGPHEAGLDHNARSPFYKQFKNLLVCKYRFPASFANGTWEETAEDGEVVDENTSPFDEGDQLEKELEPYSPSEPEDQEQDERNAHVGAGVSDGDGELEEDCEAEESGKRVQNPQMAEGDTKPPESTYLVFATPLVSGTSAEILEALQDQEEPRRLQALEHVKQTVVDSEKRAAQCLQEWNLEEAIQIINDEVAGTVLKFGLFRHGGVVGFHKATSERPTLVKLATRALTELCPEAEFTSLYISSIDERRLHRDSQNHPLTKNYAVVIKPPKSGGSLWVELQDGDTVRGPIVAASDNKGTYFGCAHPMPDRQVRRVDPFRRHWVMPWKGKRTVLVGYTVNTMRGLDTLAYEVLEDLGFVVPVVALEAGSGERPTGVAAQCVVDRACEAVESGQHEIEDDQVEFEFNWGKPCANWDLDFAGDVGGTEENALWDIAIPLPTSSAVDGKALQRKSVMMVRMQPGEPTWEEVFLKKVEVSYTTGIEEVLKSLAKPLAVVHNVAQAEVIPVLESWRQSIQKELDAVSHAIIKVVPGQEEYYQILNMPGLQVLPMKFVFTCKPPAEAPERPEDPWYRRKARIVVCGNHAQDNENEVYTSGATAEVLRIAIALASRRGWKLGVIDVTAAFLRTPIRNEPGFPVVAGSPPKLLLRLGLIKPGELWYFTHAFYGMKESPRLWSRFRDGEMNILTFVVGDIKYLLHQGKIEDTWWTIQTEDGTIEGLVIIYVDDFLICAILEVIKARAAAIENLWNTGGLQIIGRDQPVRFLGVEIEEVEGGYVLGQKAYIEELLRLHRIPETALNLIPVPRDMANFDVEEGVIAEATAIRDAQQYAGELLWISQRTRPDVAFASSLAASLSTRDPMRVSTVAERTLGFLQRTKHWVLKFIADSTELHGYADASFAPSGGKSHQGVAILLYGCPIMWKSSRQTTTAISTAECELGAELDGALALLSSGAMMEDLGLSDLSKQLWCDSTSAISLSKGASSWRTRHLRVKAMWLQERLEAHELGLGHIEGRQQLADLLTKALTSTRILELARLWGLGPREEATDSINPGTGSTARAAAAREQAARVMTVMIWCMMVVRSEGRTQPESSGRVEGHVRKSLELDTDLASLFFMLLVVGGILTMWEIAKWMGYEFIVTWTPGAKERKIRRLKKVRDAAAMAIQDELQARKARGRREREEEQEISQLLGLPQAPTTPCPTRPCPEHDDRPTPPPMPPGSSHEVYDPPPPPSTSSIRRARRNYTQYVPMPPEAIYLINDSDKYHAYNNCAGLRRLSKPLMYRQLCTFCKDQAQAESAFPIPS